MRIAGLSVLLLLSLVRPVRAQGLVDRVAGGQDSRTKSGPAPLAHASVSRGRMDLAISPDLRPLLGDPQTKSIDLGASAQWNPVCGKFDVKADFHALLGKEAREEYLKGFLTAGAGELLGSGMELFCQSMPTACSILQNNNIAANLKLLYSNDLCTSLEQSVMTGARRGRAEAIHRCLAQKVADGKTKDEAERACLVEGPPIAGFDGRLVGTLDLGREIRKYVTFTEGGSGLLDQLLQDRRLGKQDVIQEVRPNALAERYETLRDRFWGRWSEALGAAKASGTSGGLSESDLELLVPPGAPPVSRLELELVARRSEVDAQAFLASVSSAAALLALTREMNEVERKLEAIRTSPALEGSGEHSATLDTSLGRLRAERERLLRLYADQERFAQVLAAGHSMGETEIARTRLESMKRAVLRKTQVSQRLGTRPFGVPEGAPGTAAASAPRGAASAPPSPAGVCDGCGLEYSIGGRP